MFNIDYDRLKTGAFLVAGLFVVLLLNNSFVFLILFSILLFASIYEIKDLLKIEDMQLLYAIGVVVAILSFLFPKVHYIVLLIIILLASYYAYKGEFNTKIFRAVLYPILPISFFFSLISEYETIYLVWLLVVVSMSDIGGYIVGKKIGKTPFSKTSPNKTIEGVVGALASGALIGSFVGAWAVESWIIGIIISFIISFIGIFGDLYESLLKRQADVKDSGNLLPGHGGVLDRLDGFLFAAPAFYIILNYVHNT